MALHCALGHALTDGCLAGLLTAENLVDKQAQRHPRWVDALAVRPYFFEKNVLQLWCCKYLAQSVLARLGGLLAQLLQMALQVGGVGRMHVG